MTLHAPVPVPDDHSQDVPESPVGGSQVGAIGRQTLYHGGDVR